MARSIWTGAVSFGLVTIPVGLYSATQDKTIHFNQFQAGTSDRIRYQRVNERTGEEVAYRDIVKGRDIGDGEYVIVTPEELEAVEPGRSRTIDITDFVDLDDIDPIYFQKTYYLAPQNEAAQRAYELLRQAMRAQNKVGIATFVMRAKQYLVALRAEEQVLALETMFFADEVRNPVQEIDQLPVRAKLSERDLNMAKQLIDSMVTDWKPSQYRDTYRERVEELVERKREGKEIANEQPPAAEESNVRDLMQVLQASIDASKKKGTNKNPPKTDDDLDRLSKAELSERASALKIRGRSKMNRTQLQQAVAEAEASAGSRKAS